jgi:hypothetical protein
LGICYKTKPFLPNNPENIPHGIYPSDLKTYPQKTYHTHTADLFITVKPWKPASCSSTVNEISSHEKAERKLECILPCVRSQTISTRSHSRINKTMDKIKHHRLSGVGGRK